MIIVFGVIRLTELQLAEKDMSVPCLEVKLAAYEPEGTAGSLMTHTIPIDEIRQFSRHPEIREAVAEGNTEIVESALSNLATLGCVQLRKAYRELVANTQAMAGLLEGLGHDVKARETVLVESLEGDDNFPVSVGSENDLDAIGPVLFNADMMAGWFEREIAETCP